MIYFPGDINGFSQSDIVTRMFVDVVVWLDLIDVLKTFVHLLIKDAFAGHMSYAWATTELFL